MQLIKLLCSLASVAPALAGLVSGSAEGFAHGVTGGSDANPVYPRSNDELISYLTDSEARVIALDQTFDFVGSEGTVSEEGCAPWGTGAGCQTSINANNWCSNYASDAPKTNVNYDRAGTVPINVGSNKSVVGVGNKGIIKGKGLRVANGAKNVIIQNIHITELNPQYVWGGDAIALDDVDMIWIDHVTTSRIGRQHIVLGNNACNRVTISNCDIDGNTDWSPNCDGYHYWAVYFAGANDLVTFKNNYVHHTSGRGPKLAGNTLLHAVNNYWYDVQGHAFEIGEGSKVLVEGSVFQGVANPDDGNLAGQLFSSPDASANAACKPFLGHNCERNDYGSSGSLVGADVGFLSSFAGNNIASAVTYEQAKAAATNAGFGKI